MTEMKSVFEFDSEDFSSLGQDTKKSSEIKKNSCTMTSTIEKKKETNKNNATHTSLKKEGEGYKKNNDFVVGGDKQGVNQVLFDAYEEITDLQYELEQAKLNSESIDKLNSKIRQLKEEKVAQQSLVEQYYSQIQRLEIKVNEESLKVKQLSKEVEKFKNSNKKLELEKQEDQSKLKKILLVAQKKADEKIIEAEKKADAIIRSAEETIHQRIGISTNLISDVEESKINFETLQYKLNLKFEKAISELNYMKEKSNL
ncbi:hypothetical protein [Enterococcus faecalis]|uniref:hypothetical protein n=1 Tax=Enterococcus faecalis TaxID=1351 RepID=UPI002DB83E70|nr:hypothetical protein [Enterococcus faecalis]MEB8383836.1 hypothetical protein [Enterococcus faecalis]